MSGAPAFQSSPVSFQGNAFQSGVMLVGATYTVGSPAFATPGPMGFNYHFSITAYSLQSPAFATPSPYKYPFTANAYNVSALDFKTPNVWIGRPYSLGSPAFATPALASYSTITHLNANAYSLSALVYGVVSIHAAQHLSVNAYTLQSPVFAKPGNAQTHRLFANAWAVSATLAWPPAQRIGINYHFSAAAYSLGPLIWVPPTAPIKIDYGLFANAYWLQSPTPGLPFFQAQIPPPAIVLPPTYYTQAEDAAKVLGNLMNYIIKSVPAPSATDDATNELRRLASTMRDYAEQIVRSTDYGLGTQLQAVYDAADNAGASFMGIDAARLYLMSQVASKSWLTQAIYRNALVMTLGLQAKIISRMTFSTQNETQTMLTYMRDAFEAAKALGIDEVDVLVYQTLNAMGGSLMNHLGNTELQLPRYVGYQMQAVMPTLYLAQRIYGDASRAEEIAAENGVIHPAFCPVNLRVLSNAPVGPKR